MRGPYQLDRPVSCTQGEWVIAVRALAQRACQIYEEQVCMQPPSAFVSRSCRGAHDRP